MNVNTIRDRLLAIVLLILLYIFGFSIKTSAEYDCMIRRIGQSARVIAITGEPITPGLFAWITYFESCGRSFFYHDIRPARSREDSGGILPHAHWRHVGYLVQNGDGRDRSVQWYISVPLAI